MAKMKYALERGGDKPLEISWKGNAKNMEIRFNGNLIGKIPNRKELDEGQVFQLPDGSTLLVKSGYGSICVLRDDKPLPGSATDPVIRLASYCVIIYFLAGTNIILGLITFIFQVEYLQAISNGIFPIVIGFVLLVLGFFTQRRSLVALIIANIINFLEGVLIGFLSFAFALIHYRYDPLIGLLILDILQCMLFPIWLIYCWIMSCLR